MKGAASSIQQVCVCVCAQGTVSYEARVRVRVQVRDSAISEKVGCWCSRVRQLKNY